METKIVSKASAARQAKKTGKLYVIESTNDNAIAFTNGPGIPINLKMVTNLKVEEYNFPTQIYEHDPREHKKIRNIDKFIKYYYADYDVIEKG